MKSVINNLIEQNGGRGKFADGNQKATDDIYPEFLRLTKTNPSIMMSVLSLAGQTFKDPRSAFNFLVRKGILGDTEAATAKASAKATQVTSGYKNPNSGQGIDPTIAGMPGADKFSQSVTGSSDAQTSLMGAEKSSNTTDPLLTAMFTKMGSDGTDQNAQKVMVSAKNGTRIVSLNEAMTNFKNEVASGMATFSGGNLDGQNVGNYTGMGLDLTRTAAGKAESANPANQGIGSAYNAANGGATDAQGNSVTSGGVTVSLTQQAQDWLKLSNNTPTNATDAVTPPSSNNPFLRS